MAGLCLAEITAVHAQASVYAGFSARGLRPAGWHAPESLDVIQDRLFSRATALLCREVTSPSFMESILAGSKTRRASMRAFLLSPA
jgi:hypothetical protein